jgi:hypothetical protein
MAAGLLVVWAIGAAALAPPAAWGQSLQTLTLPRAEARAWRFTGFPIIAWWGPPGTATREDFVAYRDAGFTLHATNPDEGFQRALEHADAVGLKSMVFRQHQGFGLDPLLDPDFPDDRETIVGWITADEPSRRADIVRAIRTVNDLMRRDPARWAFFNLLSPHLQTSPPTELIIDGAVRNGMPILSYDTYVIMGDGTDRHEPFYDHLERFRQASLRLGVPFWAFALTIGHYNYRRPSESDLRWQHYSNLAYGAKGLWYFTYWGPVNWRGWDGQAIVDPKDGSKTELYEWVKTLNRSVLDMGRVLLGLRSVEVVHTRPHQSRRAFEPGRFWIADIKAGDALIGFFTAGDGTPYAMVVNKRHGMGRSARETADTIELTFAEGVRGVEAVSWLDGAAGSLPIRGGKATLAVHGGTGVLLKASLAEFQPAPDVPARVEAP